MDSVSVGRMAKIVVNGDSYVHERHFAPDESYVEKTWAYKLGADNIAHAGCSNERIFYSTIDYLNNNSPDTLIIGWTEYGRYMLPHTNGLNLHITPGTNLDPFFDDFITTSHDCKEYGEFYYKKMYNPFTNFQRFINYHKHLEHYCASRNIKFLNFMTLNPLPDKKELIEISKSAYMNKETTMLKQKGIEHNYNLLKNALSTFNKDVWVNKQIGLCMNDVTGHLPRWESKWERGIHPGLEASAYWLEVIKKNLN